MHGVAVLLVFLMSLPQGGSISYNGYFSIQHS